MDKDKLHFKVSCPKCGQESILTYTATPITISSWGDGGDEGGYSYAYSTITCECGFEEEFEC